MEDERMNLLLLGMVVFLGVHSVSIVSDPWRNRMAAKLGEWPWKGVYAAVSLVGFTLIVWGYGLARHDLVVIYTPPGWLHPVAMVLLVPVFPLLLAAYLLANGMLADVLLFGAFLVWAVLDRISMKHRTQRPIPSVPPSRANDLVAVVGGLALYAAFVLWLHGWLIGVPLRVS